MNFPLSQLSSTGASLTDISSRMKALAAEASGINASIASCYGQGGVGGRAYTASNQMYSQAAKVAHLGHVSSEAAKLYMKAEDSIATVVYNRSGEVYTRPVDPAPTESTSQMSTWTKIWKTGAAVASIIGAGTAAVAAWAVCAPTGVGVTGALLVSGYSTNTIANSITDLHNIWSGDQKQVGKVNYLKSCLSEGGGNLTEMLCGNREIGEAIGKGVYSAGNFVNAIISARSLSQFFGGGTSLTSPGDDVKNKILGDMPHNKASKYLQSDMFNSKYISRYNPETGKYISKTDALLNGATGNGFVDTTVKAVKEIPTAVKGYWELIMNPRIGTLRYDLKTLSYKIKNLSEVKSFIKSSQKMVELLQDMYDTVAPRTPAYPITLLR